MCVYETLRAPVLLWITHTVMRYQIFYGNLHNKTFEDASVRACEDLSLSVNQAVPA